MWVLLGLVLIVGISSFSGGIFIDLARGGAVFALLLHVIVELRSNQKRFLTSPLFLLSAIGVFFFSVAQTIWAPKGPWPDTTRDFTLYIGSHAEALILTFCMACLAVYLIVSRKSNEGISTDGASVQKFSRKYIMALFFFPVILSLFDIAIYLQDRLQLPFPFFITKLHFIAPPLLALSLCLLMRSAFSGGWLYKSIYCLLIIFVLGGLVFVGETKIVVFISLGLLLYMFRIFEFSFLRSIFAILGSLIIFFALVQVIQHTYWKVGSHYSWGVIHHSEKRERILEQISPPSSSFSKIFLGKGVFRQTETGYCLNNVFKNHSKDPFEISKQTFWIRGLVPKALWDDKPSLSLGADYAVKYCAKRPKELGHHSASITLLGQPLIHGGFIGLVIHAGILLLALGAVEKFNASRTALSTTLVVALLPWLIDFDQDFAMYIANTVKFYLVMMLLFIPIMIIERRSSRLI